MADNSTDLRVVGAVADKAKVTLYLEDGNTRVIKQGDHRLADIMEHVIPITVRGEVAIINLSTYSVYREYEEQASGLVKFFRVAKKFFGGDTPPKLVEEVYTAPPITQPVVDTSSPYAPAPVASDEVTEAVAKVLQESDLRPIEDDTEIVPEDETIVAIIEGVVIPDVQALKPYIRNAVKNNSVEGVNNFLKRVSKMVNKRAHSVVDLMRFLERGDLPIAKDGSIIAYKVLQDQDNGTFVDLHTKRVRQRVGSYVVVAEELVDKNRHNECSNGLHIARRGYLSNFGNDLSVCVLCKIAPEDVVTVPHNDPNKVRVMGYHIIGRFSSEAHQQLRNNRPIDGFKDAQKLLAEAIEGNHPAPIEEVRITQSLGGGLVITPLDQDGKPTESTQVTEEQIEKAKSINTDEGTAALADPVDVRNLNKQVNQEIEKAKTEKANDAFFDSKPDPKAAKRERDRLYRERKRAEAAKAKEPVKAPEPKAKKPSKPKTVSDVMKAEKKAAKKKQSTKAVVTAPKPAGKHTITEEAHFIYNVGDFPALKAFAKSKKKSLSALGFSDKQIAEINKK